MTTSWLRCWYPLRTVLADAADLNRLAQETGGRTPRLLSRIQRMSIVPPPPARKTNDNAKWIGRISLIAIIITALKPLLTPLFHALGINLP